MKGRASCRKCGQTVVEEIGKEIVCPGCGRVFRIPDDPRYYIRASSGSIPPVTSTGRTRGRKVSTLGKGIGRPEVTSGWRIGNLEGASPDTQESWEVKPLMVPTLSKQTVVFERFPPVGEPVSCEIGEDWIVTVELPHHSCEDVRWEIKEGNLRLWSAIEDCPYEYQILVPTEVEPSPEVRLNHGILEMRFKKS